MPRPSRATSDRRCARYGTVAWLACAVVLLSAFCHGESHAHTMRIRMDVDGATVFATLDDTPQARDFAALLPLSLTLENYAGIERIAMLPRKLSMSGAPAGIAPQAGDVAYYAPWGNLAIFVDGSAYARGLVRLGGIDAGLRALRRAGPLKVRIDRTEIAPSPAP